MHHLHFGISFNDAGFIGFDKLSSGHTIAGPRGLRDLLLQTLGLPAAPPRANRMRILLYQQALQNYLQINPSCFYAQSTQANAAAVAQHLLAERDQLIGGGWTAHPEASGPHRLNDLATVEAIYQTMVPPPGFEDQISQVIHLIEPSDVVGWQVDLYDPLEHLSPALQRLFEKFEQVGLKINNLSHITAAADPNSDLGRFQTYLHSHATDSTTTSLGDGSICIIETDNTHTAARLAANLAQTPNTLWLVADKLPQLNNALLHHSQPVMDSIQASLARPLLQVLTLAPTFLWKPIDTHLVLQFLNVRFDHIPYVLRRALSEALQTSPGIGGSKWQEARQRGIEKLPPEQQSAAEAAYRFWFERPGYDPEQGAPKTAIIELYEQIIAYSGTQKSRSLDLMAEQAHQICLMLQTAMADTFTASQLDQILAIAIDPVAQIDHEAESGHLTHVFVPAAIGAPAQHIVWWHCIQRPLAEPTVFWSPTEQAYLKNCGVVIPDRIHQGSIVLRNQLRPFLMAQQSVTIIKPVISDGQPAEHHPIFSYLHACFGKSVQKLTVAGTGLEPINTRELPAPIPNFELLPVVQPADKPLSPTAIDSLLFYPHIWTLRYAAKLRKSSLPNPADISKLQGLIGHAALEALFNQPNSTSWSDQSIAQYIDTQLDSLIAQEGAVLLAFGNEAALNDLKQNVHRAARSLCQHIKNQGWHVDGMEVALSGTLPNGLPIVGYADMILKRGSEYAIIDIKWAGSTSYYTNLLQSNLDIQLMCYAYMLNGLQFAHTAYYLISSDRLISRNKLAFEHAHVIGKQQTASPAEVYGSMWQKLLDTLAWRHHQLAKGFVEVRNEQSATALHQLYDSADLLPFFELPDKTNRFDEFVVLAGLAH